MSRRANRTATIVVAALVAVSLLSIVACKSTEPAGEQLSDAAITTKVKAKLAADPEINPFNISVETNEGVVTLQGRVAKLVAKTEAVKLARNTSGVKRVIDMIKVGDRAE